MGCSSFCRQSFFRKSGGEGTTNGTLGGIACGICDGDNALAAAKSGDLSVGIDDRN